MSEGFEGKIEIRLADIKEKYQELDREANELVKNRKALVDDYNTKVSQIDRRLNEIRNAVIDLNGRYEELIEYLPEDKRGRWTTQTPTVPEKKEPKKTTVKGKKKKK